MACNVTAGYALGQARAKFDDDQLKIHEVFDWIQDAKSHCWHGSKAESQIDELCRVVESFAVRIDKGEALRPTDYSVIGPIFDAALEHLKRNK